MRQKEQYMLKQMLKEPKQKQLLFLRDAEREHIAFQCECAINVLNGNVPINKQKLEPFEDILRVLVSKRTTEQQKRKSLSTYRGLELIRFISTPCLKHLNQNSSTV